VVANEGMGSVVSAATGMESCAAIHRFFAAALATGGVVRLPTATPAGVNKRKGGDHPAIPRPWHEPFVSQFAHGRARGNRVDCDDLADSMAD
jgi:hypothetical protein